MKYLIAILFSLLLCVNSKAEYYLVERSSFDNMRAWNNMSKALLINAATYRLFRKAGRMDVTEAMIFSAVSTLMLSTLLAIADNRNNEADAIGASVVGIAVSSACIFVFEF